LQRRLKMRKHSWTKTEKNEVVCGVCGLKLFPPKYGDIEAIQAYKESAKSECRGYIWGKIDEEISNCELAKEIDQWEQKAYKAYEKLQSK
jgi:hypothetical protein